MPGRRPHAARWDAGSRTVFLSVTLPEDQGSEKLDIPWRGKNLLAHADAVGSPDHFSVDGDPIMFFGNIGDRTVEIETSRQAFLALADAIRGPDPDLHLKDWTDKYGA